LRRAGVGVGGGRGRPSQPLAHLSFVERDFGEADYEMLLQLDEAVGPEKKRVLKENAKRVERIPTRKLGKHEV